MSKRYQITAQLTIDAKDEYRLIKAAHEAIQDGLIEPGFIIDGYIEPDKILELDDVQSDNTDE